MDDIVLAAMRKWPKVPACRGWLGLDARGRWYMRDERVQASGPFRGPQARPASRGSELKHGPLVAFIGRNYLADEAGCWYFQNGPQRVYVELEAAPWVWRLQPSGAVLSHTEAPAQVQNCLLDETGRLFLLTDLGIGLLHTQDVLAASDLVERDVWRPQAVLAADLPARFGFVLSPAEHA